MTRVASIQVLSHESVAKTAIFEPGKMMACIMKRLSCFLSDSSDFLICLHPVDDMIVAILVFVNEALG